MKTIACENLNVFRVSETNSSPCRKSYGVRTLKRWEIELITWGEGEIRTQGQMLSAHAGRIFLRWPGMVVEGFAPYHSYLLSFTGLTPAPDWENMPFYIDRMEHLEEAFKTIYSCQVREDLLSGLSSAEALCRILGEIYRSRQASISSSIARSIDYIRTHAGQELSSGTLAEEAGYSLNHYIRLFRAATGKTPVAFVQQCRIEQACVLLSESADSAEEISRRCGFSSVPYFFRIFRELTGQTPRQYRLSVRIP